jgi:hypothetical protein
LVFTPAEYQNGHNAKDDRQTDQDGEQLAIRYM